MWVPDPLYRRLPILYAGVGVLLLGVFGPSSPAAVSAGLLMAVAVLVSDQRARRRAEDRRRQRQRYSSKLLPPR